MLSDIALEGKGDLVVDSYGDLQLKQEGEAILASLFRRLATPPDGYARYSRGAKGVEILDKDYKNDAYAYLSGVDFSNGYLINEAVRQAAAFDQRLKILSVSTLKVSPTTYEVEVIYALKDYKGVYIFHV